MCHKLQHGISMRLVCHICENIPKRLQGEASRLMPDFVHQFNIIVKMTIQYHLRCVLLWHNQFEVTRRGNHFEMWFRNDLHSTTIAFHIGNPETNRTYLFLGIVYIIRNHRDQYTYFDGIHSELRSTWDFVVYWSLKPKFSLLRCFFVLWVNGQIWNVFLFS